MASAFDELKAALPWMLAESMLRYRLAMLGVPQPERITREQLLAWLKSHEARPERMLAEVCERHKDEG